MEGKDLSRGGDTKVKVKYIPRGGDISNEITITLTNNPELTEEPDLQQISPSSLLAHLGVRCLGQHVNGYSKDTPKVRAIFNAETMLAYYDIGKNYYFNRQEKFGVVIDYSKSVTTKKVNIWAGILKKSIIAGSGARAMAHASKDVCVTPKDAQML